MKKINALLSCPSDVFNDFSVAIYRAIEDINLFLEKVLDVHINLQHYITSSYSQVGKEAQDHLDDTLIINSDICLAFFYHKVGTATKKYKSGTDEEIHLMWNSGKHISLFRIYDSEDDKANQPVLDKYFKENDFPCMYKEIIGKNNLEEVVKIDIVNYIVSSFNIDIEKIDEPFAAVPFLKALINFEEKTTKLINLINAVNEATKKILKRNESFKETNELLKNDTEILEMVKKESYVKFADIAKSMSTLNLAHVGQEEIDIKDLFSESFLSNLKEFAFNNNINLEEDFFSSHGQKIFRGILPNNDGNIIVDDTLVQEKIKLLDSLRHDAIIFFEWREYIEKWDNAVLLPLALANNTTAFQSNVNVKVHIKKRDYIRKFNLIPDGTFSSEMFAIGVDSFLNPFAKYSGYEEYSYPPFSPDAMSISLFGETVDFEQTLKNRFNDMFVYEFDNTEDEIVLKVRFNELNAEEKHCFPTYLILSKETEQIYYEIFGSSLPRKKTGKINLNK